MCCSLDTGSDGSSGSARAAPKNHEKRSAVQESQGRAAVLDGRQPACVLRLALRSLPSLPFFSLFLGTALSPEVNPVQFLRGRAVAFQNQRRENSQARFPAPAGLQQEEGGGLFRTGLQAEPPLILENPDGSPTAELDRIYFREEAPL